MWRSAALQMQGPSHRCTGATLLLLLAHPPAQHEGPNPNQWALKLVPPLAFNYGPSMVNPMFHVNNTLNRVWTEEL